MVCADVFLPEDGIKSEALGYKVCSRSCAKVIDASLLMGVTPPRSYLPAAASPASPARTGAEEEGGEPRNSGPEGLEEPDPTDELGARFANLDFD